MSFNSAQQFAYDLMCSGKNVFLSGFAGTGKSYVLKRFIDEHKDATVVCAPTGIAAHHVGGATLHRTFNIPSSPCPEPGNKHCKLLDGARTVVIDEVSMVRRDTFDYVVSVIRNTEILLNRHIILTL